MNILSKANEIINKRSEEKEREYGPFIECNRKAAIIASVLCDKEITTEDIYKFQIALKLAREAFAHKEDNLLDTVAYIGALNNFHEDIEPEFPRSKFFGRDNIVVLEKEFKNLSEFKEWESKNKGKIRILKIQGPSLPTRSKYIEYIKL